MKLDFKVSGSYSRTEKFLAKMPRDKYNKVLKKYGELGVKALAEATPKDSGKTADSWDFKIESGRGYDQIVFTNSNVVKGWFNVAIELQYSHGTRHGGYVRGIDYINPAIQPIFERLADEAWKEVTSDA